ncbi:MULTISPECIES: helix-turn-helix domain-containing protein [Pseudomonas]|uniref:Transcriptional regulator, HxlR family n=1 Tax=Pseudomonas fluorescens (strain Q2-87) TaxID=1038922 RepID=J2YBY7_PSEFQ|nr:MULTISPECIES: helix-turn-helix domain-containing protein [Pseudomonas]EJL04419.1 transcriptional regulator, HxlR family [Pseudomonas fluorescens Q2-87]
MQMQHKTPETVCPVARSVEVVGDKWTILVLRELYMGATRFEEMQIQTGATPQMLTSRLKALEADGMVERRLYNQKPARYEYQLTDKGRDFYPVVYALRAWGEKWCKSEDEGLAMHFVHRACGHDVGVASVCPHCGVAVGREDLESSISEGFLNERVVRRDVFKGRL